MNYQAIRRASIILGIGYVFLTLYCFISLSDIEGLEAAATVKNAFFVGFTLLTVGPLFCSKEHKFFKASFFAFLCLDVLILAMLVMMYLQNYQQDLKSILSTPIKIILACNNAFLALGSGLFVSGTKEIFSSNKNKRMYAFAMTIEYGVTALLLLSTILELIDIQGIPKNISIGLNVGLNVVIYGGYFVFAFITAHVLKEKKIKIKKRTTK